MWAKFDDQMPRRRKVRALSDPAWRLYVSTIIDCCAEESDGVIEGWSLRELLPHHHEDYVRELVVRDLLHDSPGCTSVDCLGSQGIPATPDLYVVHDFHQWQLTAQEWGARKEMSVERGRYGMHVRWHVRHKIKEPTCRYCQDTG